MGIYKGLEINRDGKNYREIMSDTKRRSPKDILVIIVMVISIIYLINPGAGIIELIPDVVPMIGNLDEGVATTLLLSCLSYFGYNFTDLFKRKNKN